MPPLPDVVAPEPFPAGVDAVGAAAVEPVLVAFPSTLTASPDAVTGTPAPTGA